MILLLAFTAVADPLPDRPLGRPLETRVLTAQDLPLPPPSTDARYGVVELPDAVVVRPLGDAMATGFDYTTFDETVEAAFADRAATYDFAMIVHTERLPTAFPGAAAFHLTYNNTELDGLNTRYVSSPDRQVRAALWMNSLSFWDSWGDENAVWVFGQELGHYWLAYAEVAGEGLDSDALLGRSSGHWSYWLDTANSPMEGNSWRDNGDGTFTTELAAPQQFSPLDLYLMGFTEAEEVPPFFAVATDSDERFPGSQPEHVFGTIPVTVCGERVELTVADVIAAHGPRVPSAAEAPRDFTVLTILVLGPTELLTDALLDQVRARQALWADGWSTLTGGRSTVSFAIEDEGRVPPLLDRPTLVPRGAW